MGVFYEPRYDPLLPVGDYDGDKAVVIWEPTIVSPFINAPIHYSVAPENLRSTNFNTDTQTVSEVLERHMSRRVSMESEIQHYLLRGLQDNGLVGAYSNFHDVATYTLGYGHPETVRLAYM